MVAGPDRVVEQVGAHLGRDRVEDRFRFRRPLVHDLPWRAGCEHGHGRAAVRRAARRRQGGPGRALFVLGQAVAEFAGMPQSGPVELAGPNTEQIAEDEAQCPPDRERGPVGAAQDVERTGHAELPADRTVDDDEHRAAAGARRGAVQQKVRVAHRFDRCGDDREIARAAAGHHRVDCSLLRGDRASADRLDSKHLRRLEEGRIEGGRHPFRRRRHNRQAVRPAAGLEEFSNRAVAAHLVDRRGGGRRDCGGGRWLVVHRRQGSAYPGAGRRYHQGVPNQGG